MTHDQGSYDSTSTTVPPNGIAPQKPTGQLVWLITGTSSGLGLRLTASALARGDRVIATARSPSKLPSFKALCDIYAAYPSRPDGSGTSVAATKPTRIPEEYSCNLFTLELDITSGEAAIRQKLAQAAAHWGRIDVLVNNAGLSYPGISEEGGSPMFRSVFETNFFSTVDMTTAVLPYIRASKGWVVNIGSRSVWKAGIAGVGPYFTSKAALHAYTTTLATEMKEFGVRVALVAPGAMRTEGMYGGAWFGTDTTNSATDISGRPQPQTSPQFLEEYTPLRTQARQRYASIGGTEPGDPAKAMEVLIDYVKGEGAFKSPRADPTISSPTLFHPPTLVLGSQSLADVRKYCEDLLGIVEDLEGRGCGVELNF